MFLYREFLFDNRIIFHPNSIKLDLYLLQIFFVTNSPMISEWHHVSNFALLVPNVCWAAFSFLAYKTEKKMRKKLPDTVEQALCLSLKPLDTFGKQSCPRPTLHVSQRIYKVTNLWKFRPNRSSESCHDMCLK